MSKSNVISAVSRKGVPFTVYLSPKQAKALAAISRERRVSKATVVRFAVERLVEQIESGKLDLELGL